MSSQNAEIQKGIVNIAIVGNKTSLDTDCVLRKLQNINEHVVIYDILNSKYVHSGNQPDYLVYFEDFMKDPIMQKSGILHTFSLKISTKYIIVTKFSTEKEYKRASARHNVEIQNFLKFPTYANALILDVIEERIEIRKFVKTLDSSYFYSNPSDPYIFGLNIYPEMIRTLFYDNPPFSHLNLSQKITGVEGNLIDEFCKHHEYDYKTVGTSFERFLKGAMDFKFDFSLYRGMTDTSEITAEALQLNDRGASQCILVPLSIPLYVMFSSPYSKIVNILFLGSVVAVMMIWTIFKKVQRQKLGIVDSVFVALKVLLGFGVDDNHWLRWSLKENILLVPFLFMIMILMELYESHMVSNVISEHKMGSVKSIAELIESDTKIYQYYSDSPRFDPQKVVNLIPFAKSRLATIPKNFDTNYAYIVRCRFGEEFLNSEENYIGDRKLFHLIPDVDKYTRYSTYLINENTPVKNQFKVMVKALDEAGIIDHWTKDAVRNNFQQYKANEELRTISLSKLLVPMLIVVVGSILGLVVFGLEVIYYKLRCRSNRVGDIEMEMIGVRKKVRKTKDAVFRRRRHSV